MATVKLEIFLDLLGALAIYYSSSAEWLSLYQKVL